MSLADRLDRQDDRIEKQAAEIAQLRAFVTKVIGIAIGVNGTITLISAAIALWSKFAGH